MIRQIQAATALLGVIGCSSLFPQQNSFADKLSASRYELTIVDGHLAGTGAPVLRGAMEQAQFVLIGEDHGIAQIPEFVGAVCEILAPQGFHTMAIETGPLAADELQQWLATPATAQMRLVEFEKKFPETVPFFDWREENDLLSRCAQASGTKKLTLWGLDQEFMGGPKLILTRILETHPGPHAAEIAERLLHENERIDAGAAQHPVANGKIFINTVRDEDLANLKSSLKAEGSQASQSLIEGLIKSHEIHTLYNAGRAGDSNRQRALLMKSLFERKYREALKTGPVAPKVLFKFGLFHMYRGFNPMNSLEVGNHVAEIAEGRGAKSVHIMIIAARGSQLAYTTYRQPFAPRDFNQIDGDSAMLAFLKPMADNLAGSGWTLFDLRELRKNVRLIESAELRRAILGFDLLVIIPEAKPSTQLR